MAYVDDKARQINFKIVYYGPPMAGKTTSMAYMFRTTRMYSGPVWPGSEPDLPVHWPQSFSFVSLSQRRVDGLAPRFHVCNIPCSLHGDPARRQIVADADGIIFVADSQQARDEANVEWLEELACNLAAHGRDLNKTPIVLQYNKRDLPGLLSIGELDLLLAAAECPRFVSVATTGEGVAEAFRALGHALIGPVRE
jgi:GTPase SAR1 family protein